MANSKVPQFGSWTADDSAGYTAYFEAARKGKTGEPITNPNDPQMNRDVLPPTQKPPPRSTKPELKQPKFGEWDDGEEVPYTAYFENPRKGTQNPNEPQMNRDVLPSAQPKTPPQPTEGLKQPKFGEWDAEEEVPYTSYFENASRKGKGNPNEPQMNRDVGPPVATNTAKASGRSSDNPKPNPNVVKFSGGPQRVEQSPSHPRTGGARGGGGSQPSSFESVQGTPGRVRPKTPARGAHNAAGGGASIPAFGDWKKNPEQADGYTLVFDQLQKDRRGGATPSRDASSRPHKSTPGRGRRQQKGSFLSRLCACFKSQVTTD